MRRSWRGAFFFGVVCVFGGPVVWAQAAAGQVAGGAGIVVVNFNAAVLQTAEAQRDLGVVEKKFLPRQTELKRLNDEVEASRRQLSAGGDKLSEAERATREQALNGKEKRLQREAEDFRNDSQVESQQVFQRVAQKVYEVLQEYSQQHGYAAVIERGSDAAPVVWYAASTVDITGEIVKAYDARGGLPNLPAGGDGKKVGPVGRVPR